MSQNNAGSSLCVVLMGINLVVAVHFVSESNYALLAGYWAVAWLVTVAVMVEAHGPKRFAWFSFLGAFAAAVTGFGIAAFQLVSPAHKDA